MSTCVIGGASGGLAGAWKDKSETQSPPYCRTDSGSSTPRFKLIVDD